jgi:hypothetical protein
VGVRFRCSKCDNYNLCSDCYTAGATSRHDSDHPFYWIQYRRLSLPPANGEDSALLQAFARGETCESFYLHYPWFFTPETLELLIVGTEDEKESRELLLQLQEYLTGVDLHVALDALVRKLARDDWKWQEVQNRVKLLLEIQLIRSEYSGLFYSLYSRVKERDTIEQGWDTRGAKTSIDLRMQLLDTHLSSVATGRCKDAMKAFLTASVKTWITTDGPTKSSSISSIAKYTAMLSREFDVRLQRAQIIHHP